VAVFTLSKLNFITGAFPDGAYLFLICPAQRAIYLPIACNFTCSSAHIHLADSDIHNNHVNKMNISLNDFVMRFFSQHVLQK